MSSFKLLRIGLVNLYFTCRLTSLVTATAKCCLCSCFPAPNWLICFAGSCTNFRGFVCAVTHTVVLSVIRGGKGSGFQIISIHAITITCLWPNGSVTVCLIAVSFLQPELLKSLSDILKHGGNSPVSRMQAGLQLKNAVYSKDLAVRAVHQQRWLQFSEDVRVHVKQNVSVWAGSFKTLGYLVCI